MRKCLPISCITDQGRYDSPRLAREISKAVKADPAKTCAAMPVRHEPSSVYVSVRPRRCSDPMMAQAIRLYTEHAYLVCPS